MQCWSKMSTRESIYLDDRYIGASHLFVDSASINKFTKQTLICSPCFWSADHLSQVKEWCLSVPNLIDFWTLPSTLSNCKMFLLESLANFYKMCDMNKTIKDGDIAPWKDFKKEKRNQIRPYFEMGRIVKRLHFLRWLFPKISPRIPQDFYKISPRFPKISTRFPQDF